MFFIIALLIAAAAILALLLLKIDIIITAREARWSLSVRIWGFVVLRRQYEVRHETGELLTLYCVDKPQEKRVVSITDILRSIFAPDRPKGGRARGKLYRYINAKSAYRLNIQTSIGMSDAFGTAMMCGAVQSAVGALKTLNSDKRHDIRVDVRPVFSKPTFSFMGDCIITLSLANIIIGYMIYKINQRR